MFFNLCVLTFSIVLENLNFNSDQKMYNTGVITCFRCFFCQCGGTDYGALYLTNMTETSIAMCVFESCFSTKGSGGGMQIHSNQQNIYYCCFSNCFATCTFPNSWGASMLSSGRIANFSYCSSYKCLSRDGNYNIRNSVAEFTYGNNTQCSSSDCTFIQSGGSSYLLVRFNLCNKDKGGNIIGLWASGNVINIQYTSLIGNTISGASNPCFFLSMISTASYVSYCVLNQNSNSPLTGGTGIINIQNFYYSVTQYPYSYLKTYLCIGEVEYIDSPQATLEMTKINTPHLTPYRSYGDQTPHQSLFPAHTPPQTLFKELSPPQTLFPEPTPPQTLFPIHTPFHTQNPERTNQRSFPINFNERTPVSNDQSNNNANENKSDSVFMYSTGVLLIMIVAIISYSIGSQRNQNQNDENDGKIAQTKNSNHDIPYVY